MPDYVQDEILKAIRGGAVLTATAALGSYLYFRMAKVVTRRAQQKEQEEESKRSLRSDELINEGKRGTPERG